MKQSYLIATLLTLSISNIQAAMSYFETTADFTVEAELYNTPLYYVQELHATLLNLDERGSNAEAIQYQADFKARTIYTGSGTSPYSVVMSTSTRFVDRTNERDILHNKYTNNQMSGLVINSIHSNNGVSLPQIGIYNVNSESGISTTSDSNYNNLFVGGPSTAFDVTMSMTFKVDHSIDWKEVTNYFHDVTKQAFGPESIASNIHPFAPVAIVEDWTYDTNHQLPMGQSLGSYSRSFYFNSQAEADNFGRKIKTDEDILLTLFNHGIGDFTGFEAISSSTNALPEPSSTMLSCMTSLLLLCRRKK